LKFSYGWIRELVSGLTAEPLELERLITMKTAECEGISPVGAHFADVVTARIVAVEPLAKGKNKAVQLEVGNGKTATVICGAPNVRVGLLAPWVPPGTVLNGKTIQRAVIEGVESEGMLASAAELGIYRDQSGLLELTDGMPGERLRGLEPDWILEIDNKSLTHRPDLWGHYGMAREVAAITKRPLVDPVDPTILPQGEGAIRVEIADYALCPRYSALAFENLRLGASPLALAARLESIGLNSINNIVDVTNYVLAELPQPMHAFDRDKLAGDTIYVRPARRGERLEALNGETYELTDLDLVIADAAGPVALAGVIGGAASAISEETTRIVLESANFQASSVRLTSARHKLRTDASMRFEKALDPENTLRGLARATGLLRLVCPNARAVGGVTDCSAPLVKPNPISLPVRFVERKLGKQLSAREISDILRALGFGVGESTPELLTVTVPSWRATKDISLKDDLVEEVGRMVGYGEIVPVAPLVAAVVPPANPMRGYLREVRRAVAAQGFSEVYNYSFTTADDVQRFQMNLAEHIGVKNPIASELTHLRRSLLPGLFKNILSNVRHFPAFRLFEIGNEIHPDAGNGPPDETTHLGAAMYAVHADEQLFFEMKRVVECVLPAAALAPAEKTCAYEHPARAAVVSWNETPVGRLFELHPLLLAREGVEGRAVMFDLNLRLCQELAQKRPFVYVPPRKYPTIDFDMSIVAGSKMPVGEIEKLLIEQAGDSLVAIEFLRQYEGAPLAAGEKSVSYHLKIGAPDHTLSSEEAAAVHQRIIAGARAGGYQVRGVN
jgi:phenylalanyl-tRNA synthetase beta chain